MALVFMTNEEDKPYHQGNCAWRQNQRYKGFFHWRNVRVLPPLPTLGFLQQFLYGTFMSYCLRTHPPGLRDQTTPHSTSSPQSDLASYIILPGTGYISSLVNDNAASSVRTKTKG